jgi:TPR repeat protein
MNKPLTFLLSLTFLFLFSGSVYGGDLQEGLDAYESKDYKEAVKWYRLAAKNYDPVAQFKLGEMYHKGKGVPQNYKLAVKWYLISARMGNKNAKLNLRQLAKKSPDALELLITSAEDGDSQSQYHLGLIYLEVTGLKSHTLAHKWFNLASAQGNLYAEKKKIIVENKMTPQEIQKAQEMAKNWTQPSKLTIFLRLLLKTIRHKYDDLSLRFIDD